MVKSVYSGKCGADIKWRLEQDAQSKWALTLTGHGAMEDYEPERTPWAVDEEIITVLNLDDRITQIGTAAFSGFYHLREVRLPSKLRRIGALAFCGCRFLVIPDVSDEIVVGEDAFDSCFGGDF